MLSSTRLRTTATSAACTYIPSVLPGRWLQQPHAHAVQDVGLLELDHDHHSTGVTIRHDGVGLSEEEGRALPVGRYLCIGGPEGGLELAGQVVAVDLRRHLAQVLQARACHRATPSSESQPTANMCSRERCCGGLASGERAGPTCPIMSMRQVTKSPWPSIMNFFKACNHPPTHPPRQRPHGSKRSSARARRGILGQWVGGALPPYPEVGHELVAAHEQVQQPLVHHLGDAVHHLPQQGMPVPQSVVASGRRAQTALVGTEAVGSLCVSLACCSASTVS